MPLGPERGRCDPRAERERKHGGDDERGTARQQRRRRSSTLGSREAELRRPEADPAVAAGGDVEVGAACGLELRRGGPRRPIRAEARELGADPLVGPPAAPGVAGVGEAIAGRPASADPDEKAGLDELGQVVRGLRPADAGELLVARPRQVGCVGARQTVECQPLRRFQLRQEAPLALTRCSGRYRQISVLPTSRGFVQAI